MNIRITPKGVTITLTDKEFYDIDSAVVSAHDGLPISSEFRERLGDKYVPKFTETFNRLLKENR